MPGNEWLSKLEDVADQVSIKFHRLHPQNSLIHQRLLQSPHHQKNNIPISLSNLLPIFMITGATKRKESSSNYSPLMSDCNILRGRNSYVGSVS